MWANRIVSNTLEDPEQLLAHYANPRTHDGKQRDTLRASLDDVGIIASCTVNDTTGNMLDGHCRLEEYLTKGIKKVPVTHLNLTPEEELRALTYFDGIGAMAGYDQDILEGLLETIELNSEPLENLLSDIQGKAKPKKEKQAVTCPSCGHVF